MGRPRLGAARGLLKLPLKLTRGAVAGVRRWNQTTRLVRSPIFDLEFYAAQTGVAFATRKEGARHFVKTQALRTYSPHPLLSRAYLPSKVWRDWAGRGGVPALFNWVRSPQGSATVWSAFFDPRSLTEVSKSASPLSFLASLSEESQLPLQVALKHQTLTWGAVRAWSLAAAGDLVAVSSAAAELTSTPVLNPRRPNDEDHQKWVELGKELIDWDTAERGVSERVAGRVSIVIPVYEDARLTLNAVSSVARNSTSHDIEILVIDNGSSPHYSIALASAMPAFPQARLTRLDQNYNFALGSNYGAVNSSGEFVLFLNNDTSVRPHWLEPLVEKLESGSVLGVQPTLVYPDGTIQCAGIRFLTDDYLPCTPLVGHPVEDSRAVALARFKVVTAAALLMRAADVCALRGFDPIFVNGSEDIDLCLRAAALRQGWFEVEPRSVVEHHESRTPGRGLRIPENRRIFLDRWRGTALAEAIPELDRLNLQVSGVYSDASIYPAALPLITRQNRRESAAPQQAATERWSIKNPAPGGASGERWGDTHFIDDLAQALTRLDQQVVTYRFGSHNSPVTAFDDVNLAIRGIRRTAPHPGQVNVMWIISHPEDVTRDELLGYDLVYAASPRWAERATQQWGIPVRTLLQATDVSVFHPDSTTPPKTSTDVVFVGQTRPDGPRKIVMDMIETGLDVKVWGEHWARFIPKRYVQGDYFPNDRLPELYRSASIVLSDHHADMAEAGFVANRLFDAVASGARVISDHVDEIADLFHGSVRTYQTVDELRDLVLAATDETVFPAAAERYRIASEVVREHSFDARAQQLLTDVQQLTRR